MTVRDSSWRKGDVDVRPGPEDHLVQPKIIAIDIDDTLNNFSETLRRTTFARAATSPLSEEVFQRYMGQIREQLPNPTDLLSNDYSYLRYQVHEQCYRQAVARPDGVAFMQWLKSHHWQIAICTYRDLRRTNASTREWLTANSIPFDYLFMTGNKVAFCKLWGIPYLVDDDELNIVHGRHHGVSVFYPMTPARTTVVDEGRGFMSFEEIKRWI